MEALRTVSSVAPPSITRAHFSKPHLLNLTQYRKSTSKSTKYNVISPSVPTEPAAPPEEESETGILDQEEIFDWFSHWYALMPVCDLDKRAPRGMKCVYHGWCFGGSGDCKLIPQAPLDGPPVHSFPKACVGVYPSTVQYGIVWFWPNTDPQYKDILTKKKPPYIPELAHPSYAFQTYYRDIPYGSCVLIITRLTQVSCTVKIDREGGTPIDMKIEYSHKDGFATTNQQDCTWSFVSPYIFKSNIQNYTQGELGQKAPEEVVLIFFCIPVSPGNSRLITVIPRHLWVDVFYSKWRNHMIQNLVVDSDLYLLRIQEEKLLEAGPLNWQKVSFVPTKADGNVVLFRKWLKKYAGGQFDWGTKFNGALPPIPHREQFFDRYWSHVVNCSTCNGAYKRFKALEISLQVFSVASTAIMAATKPGMISVAARTTVAVAAILCFGGSLWLSRFIYKTFHFHDYNHAFK
ncbi:hypothetical protein M8C21_030012 [Ambrosia artemisiifolia]|uniref:Rieske domain-containing protein n=1 Tax=Ambrosia artemisiifolia TaxID=4212 RepID=A0AAD5CJ22_AMBAR|nr:hypothetical protein M8C21_030012 [Ambrosia artemisiifolia]